MPSTLRYGLLGALVACHAAPPPAPRGDIALVAPGAEPRRALAYTPGATAAPLRFAFPEEGLGLTVSWEPAARAADADAREPGAFDFEVTAASWPGPGPELEAQFLGMKGTALVDAHGRSSARTHGRRFTMPSIPGLLGVFIVPLPAEPVGAGARWHVVEPAPGDASVTLTADYTLVTLAADHAEVAWTGSATAGEAVTLALRGTATIRFDDVLPQAGHVEQDTMFDEGRPVTMVVTLSR